MYKYTRESYSNRWNKKHRAELNKERRIRRKLKKQHVKELEGQVKLIPKLKNKISNLQNEFISSESSEITKFKLEIIQLKDKIQSLNQLNATVTKEYVLMKSSNNEKNHKIGFLEDKLNQFNNLKSENKSLASKCSSAASIVRASKSESAAEVSNYKSFLMGKSRKGLFGKFF